MRPRRLPSVTRHGRLGRGVVSALVALTLGLAGSAAQEARFAVSTDVVEVYATVTRADGSVVSGLALADFEVLEDGVVQDVSVFSAGPFPATVALGVDRSFSMAGEPLRVARRASQAFLDLLPPSDRTMVWAVSESAELLAGLDVPRDLQRLALADVQPWGTTALFDGITAALDRLDHESGRRALVLFTDGADRYSRTTAETVLERVRGSQALLYPIAVGPTRPAVLAEVAALSGGRSHHIRRVTELESALGSVARELRQQYLLGYVSTSPVGMPGWRSITVRARQAGQVLRVRARDGYRAR
jgi:VWFA-related protein